MDLREKLGQRFVFQLPYLTELTTEAERFLVECRVGGVVLFGYNVKKLEQVAKLNRDLQALAVRHKLPPLIISLDEEGGRVSRMSADGQALIAPSQMAQAVAGPEDVQTCAVITARRLRQLGFNLNYAPVVDVNNNAANPVIGVRSYGADPHVVANLGAIAVKAYLENDISPCVKHFPGHGDTNVDSHYGLPIVDKSLEELRRVELVPFEKAIAAGTPAIMTAHIVYPQVEADNLPATLSPFFLTRLLRHEMKFEGLIFTDALTMKAISERYGLGKAAVMAFAAGADIVMPLGTLAEQRAAFEEVVAAAEAGEVDMVACDASLERLARWRERFCLPPLETEFPADAATAIAAIARQGITIKHREQNLLPLTKFQAQRPLLLDFTLEMASLVEEGRRPGLILEKALQAKLPNLLRLQIPANPSAEDVARAQIWTQPSDLLIIVMRNALRFETQAQTIQALLAASGKPIALVAAREPYDLELFPDAPLAIATYGDPPVTVNALAALLLGE